MKLSDMLFANAMMGEGGGGGGGDSDFSTATVTVTNNASGLEIRCPLIIDGAITDNHSMSANSSETVMVVLYKGECGMWCVVKNVTAVSGDAEIDDGIAFIHGDCTVTFG